MSVAVPKNVIAVNVRTVEGVDRERLMLKPFDGKRLP